MNSLITSDFGICDRFLILFIVFIIPTTFVLLSLLLVTNLEKINFM